MTTWAAIRAELLARYEHAFEHGDDELRLVLAYGPTTADRVALAIRDRETGPIVIAQIAMLDDIDAISALRIATLLDTTLAVIGDAVCVRARVSLEDESCLQRTARFALYIRRHAPRRAPASSLAFAYAL